MFSNIFKESEGCIIELKFHGVCQQCNYFSLQRSELTQKYMRHVPTSISQLNLQCKQNTHN